MMKLTNYFYLLLFLWMSSCQEADRLDIEVPAGDAPAEVSDVQVEPLPGGARLTYKIPKDPNIAYVKAEYELDNGVISETKSSIYSDTIIVEGYGDTNSHEVRLYSVGKNEKQSSPVLVNIEPLTPSVHLSFEDLEIEEGFGGVRIRMTNELRENLAIVLMADTAGDDGLTTLQTFYTKAQKGTFSFRGLTPDPKKFAVYIRDRWGNRSDTLRAELTPLFEESIPKPYTALKMETDEHIPVESQYPIENLWDDNIGSIFATRHSTSTPQWFSIDLGKPVVVSRLKAHQRHDPYTYAGSNVKSFELYGSNDPYPDEGFDNWQLIGAFESFKPSGEPLGTLTPEDIQYGYVDGEDFELEEVPPAFRYLRFKTTATYGGGPQITIGEISFWGQIK